MISVNEAKQILSDHCRPTDSVLVPVEEAAGLTLADDIISPIDLPPFKQSGMDGYAFRFRDLDAVGNLKIAGVIPAGDTSRRHLQPGQAVRIFTGAPLPENADTVVMQEHITVEDGMLVIQQAQQEGNHVRSAGAEVRAGALAMQKGTTLTAPAVGFLCGMGIRTATVYRKPKITLIITGNELQEPGRTLVFGQVYESSSYALRAACANLPVLLAPTIHVGDNPEEITQALRDAMDESDLVLLTGGVSVGDFDFVARAAESAGVTRLFHRVKQKPGKPLFAGKKGNVMIFGLPGNPSSVLSCFYQYVIPVIEAMNGRGSLLPVIQVPFIGSYQKNAGLTHFLKGHFANGAVNLLTAQESYRLSSFAQANCLIIAEESRELYQTGDMVNICLLPG